MNFCNLLPGDMLIDERKLSHFEDENIVRIWFVLATNFTHVMWMSYNTGELGLRIMNSSTIVKDMSIAPEFDIVKQ